MRGDGARDVFTYFMSKTEAAVFKAEQRLIASAINGDISVFEVEGAMSAARRDLRAAFSAMLAQLASEAARRARP